MCEFKLEFYVSYTAKHEDEAPRSTYSEASSIRIHTLHLSIVCCINVLYFEFLLWITPIMLLIPLYLYFVAVLGERRHLEIPYFRFFGFWNEFICHAALQVILDLIF